jgi:HD-like signal output (HDOD) protein
LKKQRQIVDKVLRTLDQHELSTIPSILVHLLKLCRDPKSSASDLAAICKMDKSTSARLLRAANSVYFAASNRDRIDSIRDAIVRVGFCQSEEIILSATVSPLMKTNRPINDYTSTALWRHSIAVGVAARLIFTQRFGLGILDPFMAGLLHDLGIAVENQFLMQEGFEKALVHRFEHQSLLIEEEMRHLGTNHEEIGEAVARRWNFPDHLIAVMGRHHNMSAGGDNYISLLHVIRLAEYLCFTQTQGYADFSEPYATELYESKTALGIDDHLLEWVFNELSKEMSNLVNLGWFTELRLKFH